MMVDGRLQRAAQKWGLQMKAGFQLSTLALLLVNVPASAGDPIQIEPNTNEPIKCYSESGRLGLTVGLAIKLCSGTADAKKTIECYAKASAHPDDGGLGLPVGLAVTLCKSNSLE
jgi:hypothetical protein